MSPPRVFIMFFFFLSSLLSNITPVPLCSTLLLLKYQTLHWISPPVYIASALRLNIHTIGFTVPL